MSIICCDTDEPYATPAIFELEKVEDLERRAAAAALVPWRCEVGYLKALEDDEAVPCGNVATHFVKLYADSDILTPMCVGCASGGWNIGD
jgi:hypothetical protein